MVSWRDVMVGAGVNEWDMRNVENYYCLVMPYPLFTTVSICACSLSVAQTLHSLYKKEPRGLCGLALKTKGNCLNIFGSQPAEAKAIAQFLCLWRNLLREGTGTSEQRNVCVGGMSFSFFFGTRVFLNCSRIVFLINQNCCSIQPDDIPHFLGTYKGLRSCYYF